MNVASNFAQKDSDLAQIYQERSSFARKNPNYHLKMHTKMKFSIKDFFSKCDQIRRNLVTFTGEILNGKLHFVCSVRNFDRDVQ